MYWPQSPPVIRITPSLVQFTNITFHFLHMYALSSHTYFSSFQLHLPPHKVEASTTRLSPLQIPCSTRGEGWISLLENSTLRYPFYSLPDATLLRLFLPNVFFNTKTARCSRFQIIWPMLKNLILGVQFSRLNWFALCFSGNKSVGDFEGTSLFGFTAVAPYWAERS